jgi:hypothetical protein
MERARIHSVLPHCLRRTWDGETRARLQSLDGDSWRCLVEHAERHSVGPLLHYRLRAEVGVDVPVAAQRHLRDLHLHSMLRNDAVRAQLDEMVSLARHAGLGMLALKGAYLAHCIYEEPALRPMHDIDILARATELDTLAQLLQAHGYRHAPKSEFVGEVHHHERPLVRRGALPVELHTGLDPLWAPFTHDAERVWHRASRTVDRGVELPHPAPEDVLLHVCTHAAFSHEFERGLVATCDIDALVHSTGHRLDWPRFVETANEDGSGRFAYVALRVAQTLLATPIPRDECNRLHHSADDDSIVRDAVEYILSDAEALPESVTAVRAAATLRDRIRAAWRGVFPTPATLRRIYRLEHNDRRHLLCYLARPFDLLRRKGKRVAALIMRTPAATAALQRDSRRRRIHAWARRSA